MNYDDVIGLISGEIERQGTNAFRLAADSGLPQNAVRYLLDRRRIHAPRLIQICDALGLEFYVGPPRPAAGDDPQPPDTAGQSPRPAAPPTSAADRRLARVLALLTDEYAALNDHGRESLVTRFEAAFPECRGRRARPGYRLSGAGRRARQPPKK